MDGKALKIKDRVIVATSRQTGDPPLLRHGVIVGEGRQKHSWIVRIDGLKSAYGFHKSFCRPEKTDDATPGEEAGEETADRPEALCGAADGGGHRGVGADRDAQGATDAEGA